MYEKVNADLNALWSFLVYTKSYSVILMC